MTLIERGFTERLGTLRCKQQEVLTTQRGHMTGVTAFANPTERLGREWLNSISDTFVRDAQPFEIMRTHFEERTDFLVQIVCLETMIECKRTFGISSAATCNGRVSW